MTLNQWLEETVQFDELGNRPNLKKIPLEYGSRQEMYDRRIANSKMTNDEIRYKYNQYKNNRDSRLEK